MRILSVLFIVVLLFWANPSAFAQTSPNIIFILADDLGYKDLGCYGNPFNETPHIDALAKAGMRFTQAYSSSPVCSPSRAAILTGKHPARLKLTNFQGGELKDPKSPVLPPAWTKFLPGSETTLAERLNTLGYRSGMIGKWHLSGGEGSNPWDQGFDYTRVIAKNGLDYYNYSIIGESGKPVYEDKGTDYLTDKLSDYALEFLNAEGQNGKPFFLYLAYSAPHVLLVPKANKLGKYLWKYEKFGRKYNPDYATMIESMDDGVGRIVQHLKEKGLLENTLIVFTSDNGGVALPELGPTPTNVEPLRRWKGHVYEGGIRVPAIWHWPGTIPAQESEQYFYNLDYTATLLDLLGQKQELSPDGQSIWPMVRNPGQPLDRGALYWHYPHFSNQKGRPAGAMRLGDWKLIENYETKALELYNLKDDLSESKDLAKKDPKRLKSMSERWTNWKKEIQANMPISK
jgi:arylsulfatase A